ncbi:hypothetical protein [Vibrio harveyi]|uniref:hypothetical protein n=1 Tax=Vibrio harveyi TaxID=669 RepID=UPI003CFABD56
MNIESLRTIIQGLKLSELVVPESGQLKTEIDIDQDYKLTLHREETSVNLFIHKATESYIYPLFQYSISFYLGMDTDSNVEPYEVVEYENVHVSNCSMNWNIGGPTDAADDGAHRDSLLYYVNRTRMIGNAIEAVHADILPMKQEMRTLALCNAKERQKRDEQRSIEDAKTSEQLKGEAQEIVQEENLIKLSLHEALSHIEKISNEILQGKLESKTLLAQKLRRKGDSLNRIKVEYEFKLLPNTNDLTCNIKSGPSITQTEDMRFIARKLSDSLLRKEDLV